MIVRQADGADPRGGQNLHRVERRAKAVTLGNNRGSLVGKHALQIHEPVRRPLQSRLNSGKRIRARRNLNSNRAAEHDVAPNHEIRS